MTDIIEGIRLIKQMGWEDFFRQKISDAKTAEVVGYKKLAYGKATTHAIFKHSIGFVMFIPLMVYIASGEALTLDVATAYIAIATIAHFWI
jgi:hypothetical protein